MNNITSFLQENWSFREAAPPLQKFFFVDAVVAFINFFTTAMYIH